MALEGLERRFAVMSADLPRAPYVERLDFELGVIARMGSPGIS